MVCSGFTGTVYPGLGPGPSRGGPDPRPNGVGGTRLWCGAGGAGFPRDRGAIEVTGGMEKSWKNRGFHDENCCFFDGDELCFFFFPIIALQCVNPLLNQGFRGFWAVF